MIVELNVLILYSPQCLLVRTCLILLFHFLWFMFYQTFESLVFSVLVHSFESLLFSVLNYCFSSCHSGCLVLTSGIRPDQVCCTSGTRPD